MQNKMENGKKDKSKKKRRIGLFVTLGILITLGAVLCVYMHFGGFGTGACADTVEFAKYAVPVSRLTVPADMRIVALGEATHGNAEFQQLKAEVFRKLVGTYGVRAFALEADYGCCETANRYIHGGEGTAREAAAALGFAIYRTKETEELLEWMRSYNETAAPGEDLVFYGYDMQRTSDNSKYLLEAAKAQGVDATAFAALWDTDADAHTADADARAAVITDLRDALLASGVRADAPAIHFADVLLQNLELGRGMEQAGDYNALRDRLMAENVQWVLRAEEARGNSCIFVTGHNGHLEQSGSYDAQNKVMGNLLADVLGDSYFAIGTDFFKTVCNLPRGNSGARLCHTFYSHDPLAKASKKNGFAMSYLDFSTVPETSPLFAAITDYTWMGSLGEMYNALFMNLFPMSYRVFRSPSTVYDAMIFVSDAHPTEILPLT